MIPVRSLILRNISVFSYQVSQSQNFHKTPITRISMTRSKLNSHKTCITRSATYYQHPGNVSRNLDMNKNSQSTTVLTSKL